MFHRKSEKGQALILIALAAIGLFAFAALAIDGSRAYSDKRHAQNTADTSVLAAALSYIRSSSSFATAKTAAEARATSNGYTNDSTPINSGQPNTKVFVEMCNNTNLTNQACEGIDPAKSSEYIRVRIVSTIPATFGRIIGRRTITSAAEAIARVTGGGSSSVYWPFTGSGMVSVKNGNFDKCLMMNGTGDVQIHGAGIMINCTNPNAWWMDGNSTLIMDANGKVAGCYYLNGSVNWSKTNDPIDCNQTAYTYTAASFAGVPTTEPVPPACTQPGTIASGPSNADLNGTPPSITVKKNTVTINPGNWGTIDVSSGTLTMNPGVYCIGNEIQVKAGSTIKSTSTNAVQIVLGDHNFVMNGGGSAGGVGDFENVEFYFDDGSYMQNSDKVAFTADRLRVFTTGTGNVDVNAGGSFTANDAYMYLYRGDVIWNGNTQLHLEAADSPDKYAGLLVYKPWGNTDETTFNGGSNVYIEGTFLAPTTHVIYNGGSDWELHAQVIADSFLVNGNTDVDIYYVESETYKPPSSPASVIQLTR